MKFTTNFRLNKPELSDLVNIQILNDNADVIDSELAKRALKSDDMVLSINDKTGNIVLDKSDVGLDNINNWGASTSPNYNNPNAYVTASAVKQAYDKAVEVLESSIDGKTKLSSAITDKGVLTSASDTFSKMAENINKIITLTIDGQNAQTDLVLKSIGNQYLRLNDMPYYFSEGCAVVYKDEIHILGGSDRLGNKNHYKWNGSSWTKLQDLPYGFRMGCAVVYNDEIHILGGSALHSGGATFDNHYKWNGKAWSFVSNIPYEFINGSAVVYNDEIHILGSSQYQYLSNHYKWDGKVWTKLSTLPTVSFHNGIALVYKEQIHILGGSNVVYDRHYKWNGLSWEEASTIKGGVYKTSGVVYKDQIHIPYSYSNGEYYIWNGVEWIKKRSFLVPNSLSVVYKNKIILLCPVISYAICNDCTVLV